MTTRHVADITDPVTGETATLSAATESELDQLVDEHLEQHYPTPKAEDTVAAGMGCHGGGGGDLERGGVVGGGR
jgi:hypothetical protein